MSTGKIYLKGPTEFINIGFSNGFKSFSRLTLSESRFPIVYSTIKKLSLDSIPKFISELDQSNVLSALVNLEILKITNNEFETINLDMFFKSLKTHKKIKVLDICHFYKISLASYEFIEMIKVNTSLIDLTCCIEVLEAIER
jgi:hypothetical protein